MALGMSCGKEVVYMNVDKVKVSGRVGQIDDY